MAELPSKRLRIADVASAWGCSHQHVRNLIKRGELPAIRIGSLFRIRPDDVEAYENREECQKAPPHLQPRSPERLFLRAVVGPPEGQETRFAWDKGSGNSKARPRSADGRAGIA